MTCTFCVNCDACIHDLKDVYIYVYICIYNTLIQRLIKNYILKKFKK